MSRTAAGPATPNEMVIIPMSTMSARAASEARLACVGVGVDGTDVDASCYTKFDIRFFRHLTFAVYCHSMELERRIAHLVSPIE